MNKDSFIDIFTNIFDIFYARPVYRSIKDIIDITFYPFGKSESFVDENGETKFKCQHGEIECRRNKLMTCALYVIGSDQELQVNFVTCTSFSSSSSSFKTYEECAEFLKLDWIQIESCANGKLGIQLQLEMELHSKIIKTSGHVPTITFQGKYDSTVFWEAYRDFLSAVESQMEGIKKIEM